MLSIRKLMSVVKDVDLEAMPSSIFVNDDDDDDDDTLKHKCKLPEKPHSAHHLSQVTIPDGE